MKKIAILLLLLGSFACKNDKSDADAYGHFESEELLLSPEATGKLVFLEVKEGQHVSAGDTLAKLSSSSIQVQYKQLQASISAAATKYQLLKAEEEVVRSEIQALEHEFQRIAKLHHEKAIPEQNYDQLLFKLKTARKKLAVFPNQRKAIDKEIQALETQTLHLDDLKGKTIVIAPVSGVVTQKYQSSGEVAMAGRPILKIAQLSELYLKAYVSGKQLSSFSIGDEVAIQYDDADGGYKSTTGIVSWVSDQAEFTPKIIQTKEERVNLVYALKCRVKNPGQLKIGMPGELLFIN